MSGDLSSLVKKGKHLGESLSLNKENRLAGEEGRVSVALLIRLGRILVRFGRVSLLQNIDNHIAGKERQVSFALLVRFGWASLLQNRENGITAGWFTFFLFRRRIRLHQRILEFENGLKLNARLVLME